jgi:argininosuccinate synthase
VSKHVNKVVLAYSGGLDTSVILKWLIETYDCEVVTFSADLGQPDAMGDVEQNAYKTGAVKAYVEDLREPFVKDYVFPMFRANAIYEGQYLLGTSIARPLIAKRQMEIAAIEGADAVSHGATGKGNDQVRFELGYLAIDPGITIIAPWRDWDLNSRTALMAFARKHAIAVPTTHAKPYSTDGNLLHVSYEGGILEDPWAGPPEDIFHLTVPLEAAPDTPETIEITFAAGDPLALNGQPLSPAAMLTELNRVGGKHAIGRVDIVENRYVGMKSRGVYETPGGTILRTAPHGHGVDHPGSRSASSEGQPDSEICGAGLQWLLVRTGAAVAADVDRRDPKERFRCRQTAALQRQLHGAGPQIGCFALQRGPRHLRRRRRLQPERCRGVYPPECTSVKDSEIDGILR